MSSLGFKLQAFINAVFSLGLWILQAPSFHCFTFAKEGQNEPADRKTSSPFLILEKKLYVFAQIMSILCLFWLLHSTEDVICTVLIEKNWLHCPDVVLGQNCSEQFDCKYWDDHQPVWINLDAPDVEWERKQQLC